MLQRLQKTLGLNIAITGEAGSMSVNPGRSSSVDFRRVMF